MNFKKNIISEFKLKENDSGSPEVQIALLSARILNLTVHLRKNKKDYHNRRGLISLTNKRRKILRYLKNKEPNRYNNLISRLCLRNIC